MNYIFKQTGIIIQLLTFAKIWNAKFYFENIDQLVFIKMVYLTEKQCEYFVS